MNGGTDMELYSKEMLKSLSEEEMERLRTETRNFNRRLREELDRRERYCAYCGNRLGNPDYGFKFCSAWHRYLDGQKDETTLTRMEFESKRARNRIRTIKRAKGGGADRSENSNLEESAALQASLRHLRIRRVLNEYKIITGQSFNTRMPANRRSKAPDQ